MSSSENTSRGGAAAQYVVVARRYRPQTLDELIGQEQVAKALRNAIETNRVGHAYLFTGARGVGKTSAARIFAKTLNCVSGPTPTPCNQCDICQSIAVGDDVDVIEIDGASNRGIDEIRQLRSNVNVRPSRARYKIYIIDEVHMLTKEAFNALLKTLEEPPGHVKFIFCTTDPEKIPITVLSRCQRFDFAPIETNAIVERLAEIVAAEGATAETEALELLARRAAGSMRDSQSLLEQLLAFGGNEITSEGVHGLLGTARSGRITTLVTHMIEGTAAAALAELDAAVGEGVDVGQLAEQLVGHLRDVMAAVVGCSAELLLFNAPAELPRLQEAGQTWGVETVLAALQIFDQALVRMRQSVQRRAILEMALVRACSLENLQRIGELVAQLNSGDASISGRPSRERPAAPAAELPPAPKAAPKGTKKKDVKATLNDAATNAAGTKDAVTDTRGVADVVTGFDPTSHEPPRKRKLELEADTLQSVWQAALEHLHGLDADLFSRNVRASLAGPNQLLLTFVAAHNHEMCSQPERKQRLRAALEEVTGHPVRIDLQLQQPASKKERRPKRVPTVQELVRESHAHPLVQAAVELFDGEITEVSQRAPNPDG